MVWSHSGLEGLGLDLSPSFPPGGVVRHVRRVSGAFWVDQIPEGPSAQDADDSGRVGPSLPWGGLSHHSFGAVVRGWEGSRPLRGRGVRTSMVQ